MDLSKLDILHQKLVEEKTLSKVWDYFQTNFADVREFLQLGKRIDDPFLEGMLKTILKPLYPNARGILGLTMVRVAEANFIHGGFMVGNQVGVLFCFEADRRGMIAIAELPPSTQVRYTRFTAQALPQNPQDLN